MKSLDWTSAKKLLPTGEDAKHPDIDYLFIKDGERETFSLEFYAAGENVAQSKVSLFSANADLTFAALALSEEKMNAAGVTKWDTVNLGRRGAVEQHNAAINIVNDPYTRLIVYFASMSLPDALESFKEMRSSPKELFREFSAAIVAHSAEVEVSIAPAIVGPRLNHS